jgi:L-fucose mutarotase/ribose pyranase (RbsD/FucU family)
MEFDLGDLMMVADAMMIGGNSAMMCSRNPAHQKRMFELTDKICSFLPIPKHSRRDGGYAWYDAVKAVQSCAHYDVFVVTEKHYGIQDTYKLIIEADNKRFLVSDDRITEEVALDAVEPLLDILDQQSPADAVRLVLMKADIHLEPEEWHYDFEKARKFLQAEINKLGNAEGFYARVRSAKTNYDYKYDNKIVYTLDVAAPKHQHDLVYEKFAETITKLEQEFGSAIPKM